MFFLYLQKYFLERSLISINKTNYLIMKKFLLSLAIIYGIILQAQVPAYKPGEHFKFRIHYGFFNAGYATLDLKKDIIEGKELMHAIGKGWTSGMSRWFMKINDNYESYFDEFNRPIRFIRNINEGGYTKNVELRFNHDNKKVTVIDKEKNKVETFSIPNKINDLVSVFYYLRNYDTSNLKKGDEIKVDMFFDNEIYPFKLKILGREFLRTKFGKIKALKLRPIVMSGRVFREEESLTVWVSDDDNKIPLLIKAKLMIGSLKASLMEYSGVSHNLIVKK